MPLASAGDITTKYDGALHRREQALVRLTGADPPLRSLEGSAPVLRDAERGLRILAAGPVQTVVTAPPCWSMHDYGNGDQIGRVDEIESRTGSVVQAARLSTVASTSLPRRPCMQAAPDGQVGVPTGARLLPGVHPKSRLTRS